MKKGTLYFACDFETTVFDMQEFTEVWASACVQLFTDDVLIFHSINETFNYFKKLKCNIIVYYHNLKFDGNFWLSYLLKELKLKQAYEVDENGNYKFLDTKEMKSNTFKYVISDMGQWYSITIKLGKSTIEMRDSVKLLPFTLEEIGESFQTKHKKLKMEYKGYRFSGCKISDSEKEYIKNDVLVLKEALEIMFNDGHDRLTIGSCCLAEFKRMYGKDDWNIFFPNMSNKYIDGTNMSVDEFVRKSYKGGWCYLKKGCENKEHKNGLTLDVNSLYPSVMHSKSGNYYPIGLPHYWKGNYIEERAKGKERYFFIHFKCRFHIKENKLPFIQIKDKYIYDGNECLETSDYFDKKEKKYYRYYRDKYSGEIIDTVVELTLTCVDYYLFLEHYIVEDLKIIDGVWFYAEIGLFDEYINKYAEIKKTSTGAKRSEAKLFLNNLYGKLSSGTSSNFKIALLDGEGVVKFISQEANDKESVFIPIGSAITSYARFFTITHAQKNYKYFIYSDTDSLHMECKPEEIKGVELDDVEFLCWKLESVWNKAIFVRQKTYIEHVVKESKNGELIPPKQGEFYDIKCAGMPKVCKKLLEMSLTGKNVKPFEECQEQEKEFLYQNGEVKRRTLTDFKVGFKVCGKLIPKRIKGGVILVETDFEIR